MFFINRCNKFINSVCVNWRLCISYKETMNKRWIQYWRNVIIGVIKNILEKSDNTKSYLLMVKLYKRKCYIIKIGFESSQHVDSLQQTQS